MKRVLALLLCLGLCGCGTTKVWKHPTKSKQDYYQDKLECEKFANRLAWQKYPQRIPSIHIEQDLETTKTNGSSSQETHYITEDPDSYKRSRYMDDMLKECLYSKGWTLEEITQE